MTLKLIPPGQRKDNPYYIVKGYWGGRPYEKSLKTANPNEAETRFLKLQLQLREQRGSNDEPLTFRDAVDQYLVAKNPNREWRRVFVRLRDTFGDTSAAAIKNKDLLNMALKLYPTAKNATRNRQVIVPCAAVLHHAANNDLIPWLRVQKLKEPAAQPRALSKEQAKVLIQGAEGKEQVFLLFLFHHGWRISEVLRLEWRDIDLSARTVQRFNRKTNEWQILPLQEDVMVALVNAVPKERREGRVFSWGNRSNVNRWLKPLCQKLGVVFTPHMARHSFATWAVNDGVELDALMEAGGWKDVKSVRRYGRVGRERVRAVLDRGKI